MHGLAAAPAQHSSFQSKRNPLQVGHGDLKFEILTITAFEVLHCQL